MVCNCVAAAGPGQLTTSTVSTRNISAYQREHTCETINPEIEAKVGVDHTT